MLQQLPNFINFPHWQTKRNISRRNIFFSWLDCYFGLRFVERRIWKGSCFPQDPFEFSGHTQIISKDVCPRNTVMNSQQKLFWTFLKTFPAVRNAATCGLPSIWLWWWWPTCRSYSDYENFHYEVVSTGSLLNAYILEVFDQSFVALFRSFQLLIAHLTCRAIFWEFVWDLLDVRPS